MDTYRQPTFIRSGVGTRKKWKIAACFQVCYTDQFVYLCFLNGTKKIFALFQILHAQKHWFLFSVFQRLYKLIVVLFLLVQLE